LLQVPIKSKPTFKQRAAQQAFAADGPSSVLIEDGLGTLSQSFVEGFVAAAEMQALTG
jgi:hypothetical protein